MSALAIDDDRFPVAIEIAVVIAMSLDHDRLVAVAAAVFTLADDFTISIPIAIAVAGTDGYTARADTNSDFLRASRHRNANSGHRDRHHCKTFDHGMLLSLCEKVWELSEIAIRAGVNGSVERSISAAASQGFIASHIVITTKAKTIAAHTTGVTRFELPLRGELLAAWLNSRFI
jgi:hypothetical protein